MEYKLREKGRIWRGSAVDADGTDVLGSSVISFDGKKVYHLFTTEIDELTDEQIKIAVESDPSLKFALIDFRK